MSPVHTDFSPSDLATAPAPYALLRSERSKGAVLRSENSWIVLGRAEGEAVLRSPLARSGFVAELYRTLLPPGAARDEMGSRINFLDPPDHGRVRGLISKAFTPRRVSELRPYLESICVQYLDRIGDHENVDLLADFAHEIPALAISELLGVPAEDRHRLTGLSDQVAGLLTAATMGEDAFAEALAAAEELHTYLRALLEERRQRPADDLVSGLIQAREGEVTLSEKELLSLCATLYSAGHRTTRDLFINGLTALLPDTDLRRDMAEGRVPTTHVVEEFLRFETPTHYVARMLSEPMEIAGVEIPAGEPIVVCLAAANRDEEAYQDAARFDPRRWGHEPPPPPPLSFVFGLHFCLGASLARLEVEVLLETLFARFPNLQLATEPENLRWRHTGLFRGVHELLVTPNP